MQRRLLKTERILVASPNYIARMPAVREPTDLTGHNCLTYWMGPDTVIWTFMRRGKLKELAVPSACSTNNGYVLCQLAVMGHGIALLDDYTVSREIKSGRLRQLLPSWRVTNSSFDEGIYATFQQTGYLPGKIRAFLDFMAEHVPVQIRKAAGKANDGRKLDRSVSRKYGSLR